MAQERDMGASTSQASAGGARRVVVIAGPTAVGKSALALRLCETLRGELISVDSVQVYRGLQIGANKPSAAEIDRVRHHLLDLREPDEGYTAGAFYTDALRAVDEVLARGRVPVLVGGTSMYLQWLVGGRPTAPKADPETAERVRLQLAPLEAADDWPAGIAELQKLDPKSAEKLSRNDWYRLQRALEVAQQTQSTAAELPPPPDPDGLDELRASLDMRCFFLSAPREPLCRRIDTRCESMLHGGLLEETTELLASGRLLPSCPAGRAIGYKQALQYLVRDQWQPGDAAALVSFVEGFAAASRKYAGQQTKWFRRESQFEWVASDWEQPELTEQYVRSRVAVDRSTFDLGLASEQQRAMRTVDKSVGQQMKTYLPQVGRAAPTTLPVHSLAAPYAQSLVACHAPALFSPCNPSDTCTPMHRHDRCQGACQRARAARRSYRGLTPAVPS